MQIGFQYYDFSIGYKLQIFLSCQLNSENKKNSIGKYNNK